MQHFPAHVPILQYDAGIDGEGSRSRENTLAWGVRVAWIDHRADLSPEVLSRLLLDHELILVAGCGIEPAKLPMPRLSDIVGRADLGEPQTIAEQLRSWLNRCRRQTPVYGAVLIGGGSTRMGRPKHLIRTPDGRSWLELLVSLLEPFVTTTVVSGAGELPDPLMQIERIEDLPGVHGPLAGVGALLRNRPLVSWLVCACDMPHISRASIKWLLAQRNLGHAAVVPVNPETGRSEPLFAWYDYRCRPLVDDLIAAGSRKISALCGNAAVYQPHIPHQQSGSWRNINYPDQL